LGPKEFPFYCLNAHLYLLIALDRISLENAEILLKNKEMFYKYIHWKVPHALIQIKALSIVKNIEKAFPGTYEKEAYDSTLLVGKSSFPLKIIDDIHEAESDYYEDEDLEEDVKFYHGYDFDRYWFEPLAKIFGVSGKMVEKLATNVILNEWNLSYGGRYIQDPRNSLWDSARYEQKTWHSHEQHPEVERYNFYLSYHAMFVVASRLLKKMPIVYRKNWDEKNPWDEWIERQGLCRQDGFWLSDCRGNVPLEEPRWFNETKNKNWRTDVSNCEFLDNIVMNDGGICVKGYWENAQESYREEVSIASALASEETSKALLSALITCKNSRDYKLPDYNEQRMEYNLNPFVLLGWIKNNDAESGLDRFDPWAGNISYPDYGVGEIYEDLLGLQVNSLENKWYKENSSEVQIVCENWSRLLHNYGEDEAICGKRMIATLDILTQLCKETGLNLVIEVQISRRIKRDRYSNSIEEDIYIPPKQKIYLLSKEGVLSDERGNIRFGQDVSK
jgi:hypothetical protein